MRALRRVRNGTDGVGADVVSSTLQEIMTMPGWLEDAGVLLLVVLAFPLVVLVVGTPVALVVRLLIEFSRRWW
jgi:hypothetical protein